MNTADLFVNRAERGTARGADSVMAAARSFVPTVEAERHTGSKNRPVRLVVLACVMVSGIVASVVLLSRGHTSVVTTTNQPVAAARDQPTGADGPGNVARGDATTANSETFEAAPDAEGVTISVITYEAGELFGSNIDVEPTDGPCELVVYSLEGVSRNTGHCVDDDPSQAMSLSEAELGGTVLTLRGRLFQIIDGRLAPDAFPSGTSIQADMHDGRVAVMAIRPDGRFFKVVELESEPGRGADVALVPLVWRAVAQNGSVLDTHTVVRPDYPIPGP